LPAADEAAKEELEREYGEYEKLVSRTAALAREKGIILKEPGPFKKAMMWSSIKLNTMKDDSRAHIAEMMTKGTVVASRASKAAFPTAPTGWIRRSESSSRMPSAWRKALNASGRR